MFQHFYFLKLKNHFSNLAFCYSLKICQIDWLLKTLIYIVYNYVFWTVNTYAFKLYIHMLLHIKCYYKSRGGGTSTSADRNICLSNNKNHACCEVAFAATSLPFTITFWCLFPKHWLIFVQLHPLSPHSLQHNELSAPSGHQYPLRRRGPSHLCTPLQ